MTEDKQSIEGEATPKVQLAGVVIENEEGKILVIHRNTPELQQWETIGGKKEHVDVDLEATAIREASEEADIEVEIRNKIGQQDFTENGHVMGYAWYEGTILSGTPVAAENKHDLVRYFSYEELKEKVDLSPNLKNLVNFHFSLK